MKEFESKIYKTWTMKVSKVKISSNPNEIQKVVSLRKRSVFIVDVEKRILFEGRRTKSRAFERYRIKTTRRNDRKTAKRILRKQCADSARTDV